MRKLTLVPLLCMLSVVSWAQGIEPDVPDVNVPAEVLDMASIVITEAEFGIPREAAAASFSHEVPLPELETVTIKEPVFASRLPGTGITFPKQGGDRSIVSEMMLGTGSQSHVYGEVFLYTMRGLPTFELNFNHDSLEWYRDQSVGSFYYKRDDSVDGTLKATIGKLGVEAAAGYADREIGLQSNSSYDIRIHRAVSTIFTADYMVTEYFQVSGAPELKLASVQLKGASSKRMSELSAAIDISGELLFETMKFGLTSGYSFRTLVESPDPAINLTNHRLAADLTLGIKLPFSDLYVDGHGGWLYSTALGHQFPFSLGLAGAPFEFMSFDLRGGYAADELDAHDIFEAFEFANLPDTVTDNYAWNGSLDTYFTLLDVISVEVGLGLAWNNSLPYFAPYDPADPSASLVEGFFPLTFKNVLSVEPEIFLGWDVGSDFVLQLGWSAMFFGDTALVPTNTIIFDGSGRGSSGRFGAGFSVRLLMGPPNPDIQLPYFDLNGYYRVTDNFKIMAAVTDVLAPLIGLSTGGSRYSWQPYEEPGLQADFGLQINL